MTGHSPSSAPRRTAGRYLSLAGLAAVAACAGTTSRVESTGDVAVARDSVADTTVTTTTTAGTTAGTTGNARTFIAAWPEKQRETASTLIAKYGEPDAAGPTMLAWHDREPFTMIEVHRNEVPHNFPMPHADYLTQTIKHTVPADKLADLYQFDGSVWFHRTRGELSAQCDKVPMNLLALNLAHDVISGKRTVDDARAFYATTATAYMQGDSTSTYVTGLTFPTEPNAADPDKPHQK